MARREIKKEINARRKNINKGGGDNDRKNNRKGED
jgi:hypothetical protein